MIPQILIDKINESQFHGLPENVVADALNAPDDSLPYVKQDVATSDFKEILLLTTELYDISQATVSTTEDIKRASFLVQKTFDSTTIIRTSVPDIFTGVTEVLGGLLTAGVISQGTYDAMIGLTNRRPSWAEHHGLYPVTARDVGLARGGQ